MTEQAPVEIPDVAGDKIREILSRDGVAEPVRNWYKQFAAHEGRENLCGITVDGLIIGIKFIYNPDDPKAWRGYNAWVLDASLPADQIEKETVYTDFTLGSVTVYRDGGTTEFPSPGSSVFGLAKLADDEIRQKYPEDPEGMVNFVRFYRKTGDIFIPAPHILQAGGNLPEAGNKILFPLPDEITS